jgi:hypothetical protein
MMALPFAVFLCCATILLIVERHLAPLANRYLDVRYPKMVSQEKPTIPMDLVVWANGYEAQWAIDDARTFLLEEYDRSKDWDQVRLSARMRADV